MAELTVGVFVGTRADLGPLLSVLVEIQSRPELRLRVLTGVAFDEDSLRRELVAGGLELPGEGIRALAPPLAEFGAHQLSAYGPVLAGGLHTFLELDPPDVLLLLGDRWELLFLAPTAYLRRIPLVHLHGGEVTEGALDERVRHAVTKLADVHCCATDDAARRLRQLGEPDDRIFVTGAPGLDRVALARALTEEEFADLVGRPISRPLALFTYHPSTAASPDTDHGRLAEEAASAALKACALVVATHPGNDPGREQILDRLSRLADITPTFLFLPALGAAYAAMLHTVDLVVGNSSSGLIEAGSTGVPVVDIGHRQQGRLRGDNVVHCEEGEESVERAIRHALSEDFRRLASAAENPYGTPGAAARVASLLSGVNRLPRDKQFIDRALPC